MDAIKLNRLTYLAAELGAAARIPKLLQQYLVQGEMLDGIAHYGLIGYAEIAGIDIEQIMACKQMGSDSGLYVDVQEYRHILASAVRDELLFRAQDIRPSVFYAVTNEVNRWLDNPNSGIIENDEFDLSVVSDDKITYLRTGFTPLDMVIGGPESPGIFPGLYIVMGHPGTGKTAHLLRTMEKIRHTNNATPPLDYLVCDSLRMYQLEIPKRLIGPRVSPAQHRTKFKADGADLIKCGSFSMNDIITECEDDPNPNRVVFIDSPDVMAGGSEEGRRFALEAIYRDLIRLKRLVAAVFVASQPRRDDEKLSMQSVSESYAKAHYADAIIGIEKQKVDAPAGDPNTVFSMKVLKSRFSPDSRRHLYNFDLGTLEDTVLAHANVQQGAQDEGTW